MNIFREVLESSQELIKFENFDAEVKLDLASLASSGQSPELSSQVFNFFSESYLKFAFVLKYEAKKPSKYS